MKDTLNIFLNPSVFPLILTNAGFLPKDFRENFNFCGISYDINLTWLVLAYLFPKANFNILLLQENLSDKDNEYIRKLNLKNLKFNSFKDFKALNSFFDFVALDFPYSSLYASEKEKLKELLKHSLNKGGNFFVQYDSLPGSDEKFTLLRFLRELLRDRAQNPESVLEEIEIFLHRPTMFINTHPPLRNYLNNVLNEKPEEIIEREILNEDYQAYLFSDIVREFKELGLSFAGRADLELNDPEISLFPSHVPTILRYKNDTAKKETAIDFILNISEHRDIYVKEPVQNFEEALNFIGDNYYLIPRQNPSNLRRIVALPGGHRFPLTSAIYDYFFTQGENPVRLKAHPFFKGNEGAVWKAFYKVAATGEFFICVEENLRPLSEIKEELPERFSLNPLNELILEEGYKELKGVYLTSEVTKGACIHLTPLETLLLWFSYKEGKGNAENLTYDYLQSSDKRINVGGETKKAKEVGKEEIEKTAKRLFKGRKAFNLQRLRIVEF